MPEQVTVYYADEHQDLIDFMEEYEELFNGATHMHRVAMRVFKDEKEEALQELVHTEESDTLV